MKSSDDEFSTWQPQGKWLLMISCPSRFIALVSNECWFFVHIYPIWASVSVPSHPGTCLSGLIAGPEQDAYFQTCLEKFNTCLVVSKIRIHALFKYSSLYKRNWKANWMDLRSVLQPLSIIVTYHGCYSINGTSGSNIIIWLSKLLFLPWIV